MPFSQYKSIADVAQQFQIEYRIGNFVQERPFTVGENFREDLDFILTHGAIYHSEYAICENLIYPILKEVWKAYDDKLVLWSHPTLTYDETVLKNLDKL